MKIRIRKRKAIRLAAAATGVLCAAVITAAGVAAARLPDSFTAEQGSTITVGTVFPVTERKSGTVETSACGTEGRQVTLELFGSVPVKDVTKKTIKRPRLIAGGQAFGIKLVTDGVMVIDLKYMSGVCPAKEAGLRIGDVIETINGETVRSNSRIAEIIKSSGGSECRIEYRRGNESLECMLKPVFSSGSYRAGMWVRDSSAGIGTLTFIDPETLAFAGLGHSICDPDTREPLPLSQGTAADVRIDGVTRSAKGEPGQLLGEFDGDDLGDLTLNCEAGVCGVMYGGSLPENAAVYPLGFSHEVHKGAAYMIAQIDGGEPQRFDITIESVFPDSSGHDLVIHTDDKRLIEQAGGIVQGMSGSPIIQDGRLIGAVTHVFVDDPCGGYGIFADKMYAFADESR